MARGAYQYHPVIQAHLESSGPTEIDFFYDRTQILNAGQSALLKDEGRLIEADLTLRQKVNRL